MRFKQGHSVAAYGAKVQAQFDLSAFLPDGLIAILEFVLSTISFHRPETRYLKGI